MWAVSSSPVIWPSILARKWIWIEDQEIRSFKRVTMTAPSARSRIRRVPSRADYERETIDAILDEALVAHLGFAVEGQPYVIPTLHARVGDVVYVHGSAASRAIRALTAGVQACLTVTLLDGLVLARSAFHHSMNYRSVVVLGEARPVEGPEERLKALEAFTERLDPGPLGRGALADAARSSRARACSRSTSTRRRPRSAPARRWTTTRTMRWTSGRA